MSEITSPTYFILDNQQGQNPEDGWRIQTVTQVQISPQGLQLSSLPSPPVPLKDAQGTFGGLTNPTGVAVDAQGVIYIADATQHQIFRLTRRDKLQVWAKFFRISQGPFKSDRFVYVPTAQRLERWRAARQDPASFAEVEVIKERVFDEIQASKLIICYIQTQPPETTTNLCNPVTEERELAKEIIAEIWEAPYPEYLPAGKICQSSLDYLPCVGGLGNAPRQFNEPRGLAISPKGNLYVADSQNHRLQVFALPHLVLTAIWGSNAGNNAGEFNEPWDVVVDRSENIYIADKGNHRLQKYDYRQRYFIAFDGTNLRANFFQVLYGNLPGDRFIFIPARRRLEQWSRSLGRNPNNLSEVTIISTQIDTLDAARQHILEILNAKGATDILVEWSDIYPLESDVEFDSPTHLAIDAEGNLYVVDSSRDYVKVLDSQGRVIKQISFLSEVVSQFPITAVTVDADGKLILANSQGLHRFDLHKGYQGYCGTCKVDCNSLATDINGDIIAVGGDLGEVSLIPPPKTFETQGTYFSHPLDSNIYRCQWHKIILQTDSIPISTSIKFWTYTSEEKLTQVDIQALQPEDWYTGQLNAEDFLILSPPGRFLWLKIEFVGNGTITPILKQLKIYFPRLSYLQYLPAVYQADLVSKDFLERFLSIFETVLGSVENKIDRIAEYFDPDGVPDRKFLEWLAAWVDMKFYQGWSLATCRRLLRHAPELYRQRGTVAGLKLILRLAFGVEVEILEHFRLRRWLFLNSQSSLTGGAVLWGNQILNYPQLGENSHLGNLTLQGTSEPISDMFSAFAHRFSVFIPVTETRSDRETQIRALIAAEKPSHTQYTLHKVEPRFRVGVQSTLGFNTLVGGYPRLVLNHCATLGYDAVLNSSPESKTVGIQVGNRRVGVTTQL